MNISIFGLGYVGCVGLGCLARLGNNVIGVDISDFKVELINSGKPTIIEKDIDLIISEEYRNGRISATMDYMDAVEKSDVSFICVGTPSTHSGHLDLTYLFQTAKQIAEGIKIKNNFHIIAIRSTVPPGTNEKIIEIIKDISSKYPNKNFAVVSNPEFLREGNAVDDFFNPPLTLLGSNNEYAIDIMKEIYKPIKAPVEVVPVKVAEIIKYVNNTFHALKVVFANEIGNICKKLNIDSHEVMRIFCLDTKLNISTSYLKPGFAYGGSCLPKDLKALKTFAHDNYIDLPVIENIENSNEIQKQNAFNLIISKNKKKIAILGLSFKPETDDLRFSPIIDVIEKLIGKGYEVKIFDSNVHLSKLIGKNKSYIEEKLPHISQILSNDLEDILNWAEIIVVTNRQKEFEHLKIDESKFIIDLARIESLMNFKNYEGICW